MAADWLNPSQARIWGQARNVPTETIKIAAWLTVMSIAISRRFQNGRVSWTPRITFIASMMPTNKLEDNQRRAARPKEIMPVGGCSRRRFNSRAISESASGREQVREVGRSARCPADSGATPISRMIHGKTLDCQADDQSHERHQGGDRVEGDGGRPRQDLMIVDSGPGPYGRFASRQSAQVQRRR